MHRTEVAIVGTGPYGLSLGAHLGNAGVPFRIVGKVMETWREQMPVGMLLKSDGFASNLSDPHGEFTLERYCAENSIPYATMGAPVHLSTFAGYGQEFQRRVVPQVEEAMLTRLERGEDGFLLTLDTGETFAARKVVLAVGITHYAYVPPVLHTLPKEVLRHSSEAARPAEFAGKEVAIVGGGASAIDLAALLHEAGAKVTIASRRPLRFHTKGEAGKRTFWARLRMPSSGIGPGWKLRLLTELPHWYRFLPRSTRLRGLARILGPSAGWPMRERVEGKVEVLSGMAPKGARVHNGRVALNFAREDGELTQIEVDKVIAATGYHVDLRRLPFLPETLRREIREVNHMPELSGRFESSVPGLYFIGVSSSLSFGPMMRFSYGAAYTAKRLHRHLARRAGHSKVYEEEAAATV
ncbi:MAG TPA: NAD(P)-binding domain-containing protein [Acidobacteriaceae bacterium]